MIAVTPQSMQGPFIRYYGGKWRAAPRYPAPVHDTIVEPFAGAAGYAMRHYQRRVILVEKYPRLAEMWRYLIGVSAAEIRRIPEVDNVEDLPTWCPDGARTLVGFSMNSACSTPRKTLSAGRRKLRALNRQFEGWTPALCARVAHQVDLIKHWQIIEGDYLDAPDVVATWFIDPPYQRAGKYYVFGSAKLDYTTLGDWCQWVSGQVIVCEAQGADWLPFQPFALERGQNGRTSAEGVWIR